jgi:drug/metabolite transporter (DMT)-like permease
MPHLHPMAQKPVAFFSWLLFVVLSVIWGSSFILMKLGLYDAAGKPVLSAYQVAALRMLSAGLCLLPFIIKAFREIPGEKIKFIVLSGFLGSFFPAFLFCIAETQIDSALAGSLNALTPIFVILIGVFVYKSVVSKSNIIGAAVALAGCFLLLVAKYNSTTGNWLYTGYVIIATILYGINVNVVKHRLHQVGSINIATIAFVSLIIPALLVLFFTGYFQLPLTEVTYLKATGASALLGAAGTAVASVLFYMLVKRAGALFSSMVTYGIPFIAILWGVYYGETVTLMQVLSLAVILAGVYIANK